MIYTCTRCLSGTFNDDDLCDACVAEIYKTPEFGGSTIRTDQIPDEVECAFRKAWMDGTLTAKGAIAAALNAWPEALHITEGQFGRVNAEIILPLPQKGGDA
jgi:hypothetical protein